MIRKSTTRLQETSGVPETEADLRLIMDTSPIPMAALAGSDHILSYVNSAFCRLACRSKDELTGKPFVEVVSWEGCLSLLDRVYSTGEVKIQTEPDRTERQIAPRSYTMWPIRDGEDQPVGVMMDVTETAQSHQRAIAINEQLLLSGVRQLELRETAEKLNAQLKHEIADRERMEVALLDSEKLAVAARFALTMAHEINNPLEAITNLVYLLGPLQTSEQARSHLATIEEQLKGLSRISTQMLKFHRDSNKPSAFQLGTVLSEVSDFYSPEAKSRGIAIHQRFETHGTISAFRSEVVQVITNILLNALDATPPGGRVIMHLYPAPSWLCEARGSSGYCLSIADTGKGIASEDRDRIYQPFFTTKGERGTGLGLWVSAGIIDRAGGSIRVWSSRRPGRSGTCFSIFLPEEGAILAPLGLLLENGS